MTTSIARKTRPTVRAGVYVESGPSSSFVDNDYDEVLTAELRAPDHRCDPQPRKASPGARFTCPECETVYIWSEATFKQWLPHYESSGQLPHSHVQHGDTDENGAELGWSSFGGVALGEAI